MIIKLISLKNHPGFIRYFKNTSWIMAEQFLRIIAGLFVGIWVARYLGPEKFGLFSYVLAFTAIIGGIAKLGLDGILVRELVNHSEKHDIYLGTAFWLKILGAFLVMGIMAAIVPFTSNDATTNLFIFIITAGMVFQSFEVVEFYFQSQVLAKIISICKVIQLSLSSTIKIYLVLTEAELLYFVLVTAFDSLSLALSYFIAYKLHKNLGFFTHFNLSIAKQLLKDSWPLILSAIVVMIYMRIDQIMIKEMLGEYEVGIYSAAARLSEAFYFIPVLILTSLFPAILNAKKRSEELYKQRLQLLYTFMAWMAIGIALPMTFLADWLIVLLFGQAYQEAGQVLMIHVWAAIFVFIGVSFGKYLLAENLTKIAFQRTLLGAASNVLLNFWLIPIYGITGAAIATLLAQFIANFGYDIFDKRLHQQLKMKTKAILMPWTIISLSK
jgi:O-antigen/teichoic acid export membrane protein